MRRSANKTEAPRFIKVVILYFSNCFVVFINYIIQKKISLEKIYFCAFCFWSNFEN